MKINKIIFGLKMALILKNKKNTNTADKYGIEEGLENIINNKNMDKLKNKKLFLTILFIIKKIKNMTKQEKIVSVSIYLGQSSKSTDKASIGIAKAIAKGLTFNNSKLLENKINENKIKTRFKYMNAICHPVPKNNFENATKITGIVYKYFGAINEPSV